MQHTWDKLKECGCENSPLGSEAEYPNVDRNRNQNHYIRNQTNKFNHKDMKTNIYIHYHSSNSFGAENGKHFFAKKT